MHVSVTGLSHHETPISLRERFAFARDDLGEALKRLPAGLGAAAILSTCNRTELYLASDARVTANQAIAGLAKARGESVPEAAFYHYEGAAAVRHLYRVAAGVDSLVLGESEILGQVREAFSAATTAERSSAVLARLFHTALRTGRRARSETEIGSHGLSISAIAVALSRGALGSLRRKTVLVVGAGEAGQRAAAALVQSGGAGRLLVTTRTAGRADEIAGELNGLALPFEEMPAALAESDVVISATSAPDAVILASHVKAAMKSRADRELVIVDIAVPRDVEPAVRKVPGVHLYDIDDLEAVADKNLDARKREVEAVEAIIEEEVSRFQGWLSGHSVQPVIAALRRNAEATRQSELDRTLKRLSHLSEEDQQRVEAMSKALVKRLLHNPVARLREGGQERHVDAVRDLFELDESTPD